MSEQKTLLLSESTRTVDVACYAGRYPCSMYCSSLRTAKPPMDMKAILMNDVLCSLPA